MVTNITAYCFGISSNIFLANTAWKFVIWFIQDRFFGHILLDNLKTIEMYGYIDSIRDFTNDQITWMN